MNKLRIIMGDWSGDGHSMTSTYTYDCSITKSELLEAYKKGTELIGFDLSKNVCVEYEDDKILKSHIEKINEYIPYFKFDDFNMEEYDTYDDCDLRITYDDFVRLYFEICRLGCDFVYKQVESEDINIGGYGLFYN